MPESNINIKLAQNEIFESNRLRLRRIKMSDAADIFSYASDPQLATNAGFKVAVTLEDTQNDIATWFETNRLNIWGLEDKLSGRLIGSIQLKITGRRGEFGWSLNPDFWGQSLMAEAAGLLRDFAFSELALDVLITAF